MEWGQPPRCPPRAGTDLGSFQKNPHLGTPPDSSGRGAEACAHLPRPTTFPPGQNGETEADGPCLEDQRSVNFCPLAFVHVGVLEALKSRVLIPGPVFSRRKGFKQERAPSGQGLLAGENPVASRRRAERTKLETWLPCQCSPPPLLRGLPGAHPATSPLPLVWPGWRRWLWASDTLESPRSELRAWPPSQANSRRRECYLSAQGAGEKPSRALGQGLTGGWGRVLNLLKAVEELDLLTGLKGEAVVSRIWTIL